MTIDIAAARALLTTTGSWKDRSLASALLDELEAVRNERDTLTHRRDELLATIARLSNELPFPDEVKGWTEQRAKLLAEIGTLKAERDEAERRTAEAMATWLERRNTSMMSPASRRRLVVDIRSGTWKEQ